MTDRADRADVAERYQRFAGVEAPGRSPLYGVWAAGVAGDPAACDVIARLPPDRRQPPLVFALARMRGVPEGEYEALASWLGENGDALVADASARSLQTNEPQRTAVLVPALSAFPGTLALIELGASAGLCMLPDRYSYRYAGTRPATLDPAGGVSPVVLTCDVRGDFMPDVRMPDIVWRAGVDLRPLDCADPADRRFAAALVWPGETGRAARMSAALDVAAAAGPRIEQGDATDPAVIHRLVAEAPEGTTVVVTTPGLLPHIGRAGREAMIDTLMALHVERGVHWISLDPPGLHARWKTPLDAERWQGFVLSTDGHVLGAADPLGAWLEWRAGATQ